MKAATPPRRWASAMTCWQTVVLPDDSGPKISVIRPRGMPPTPSARSRAIEPVGMKSTCCRASRAELHDRAGPELLLDREDRRVHGLAALRLGALGRAVRPAGRSPFRSSAGRCPVIAIVVTLLSPQLPLRQAVPLASGRGSALVGLSPRPASASAASGSAPPVAAAAPRARTALAGRALSFGFFFASRWGRSREPIDAPPRSRRRLPGRSSRGLLRGFTGAHPARAQSKLRHDSWEGSGSNGAPDPGHEV